MTDKEKRKKQSVKWERRRKERSTKRKKEAVVISYQAAIGSSI